MGKFYLLPNLYFCVCLRFDVLIVNNYRKFCAFKVYNQSIGNVYHVSKPCEA